MDLLFILNLLAWSLQVALLAAVAALAFRLFPIDSASVRHAWWRAVLVVCLTLPLLQPWRQMTATLVVPDADTSLLTAGTPQAPQPGMAAPAVGRFQPANRNWPQALAVALAVGATLRLAWVAAGLVRLRRLRRAGVRALPSEADADLQRLVEAGAEIRYVESIGQPVTFGMRRPVVLLPASLRARTPDIQRAVLAHELWHVRRRDWVWVIAEEALRGVLWFHPGIWWLISRVQASREEVVDELTVLLTNSRRGYLEALLAFADEPPLFPAAPFARRRHLFNRMLLISKEGVMSSKRIVASAAAMVGVLAAAGWYGVGAFPLSAPAGGQQAPPRDPQPPQRQEMVFVSAEAREAELKKVIASTPDDARAYYELAKLQEDRGAAAEAEATLIALRQAFPRNMDTYQALASLYLRTNRFDRGVGVLEEGAAIDPADPRGHHLVATFYEDKVRKDPTLTPTEKQTYILQGISAEDRALAINPDFLEAMIYRGILLRHQANTVSDRTRQAAIIAEAEKMRNRALELQKAAGNAPPPPPAGDRKMPPPPPPPPPPGAGPVMGQAPLRVGGNIPPPRKIKNVDPVYPPEAMAQDVQGVVVLETTIDEIGRVKTARVLRSIPLLDQAALDAVKEWEFEPTHLNGAPVPVIMTVTINFSKQ